MAYSPDSKLDILAIIIKRLNFTGTYTKDINVVLKKQIPKLNFAIFIYCKIRVGILVL